MPAVCAVDVGTTRIKALVLSEEVTPGPVAAAPSELETPQPGAAEIDADALWRRVLTVLRGVSATAGQVAALAITNQRATVFLVDDAGTPLARGLSWQDRRGERALSAWLERVGAAHFAQATGLVPSTLWSLARILWWQQRGLPPGARFATVQDWLLRRLGADAWVLDPANASAVGLLNAHTLTWDDTLLQASGVSRAQLPALAASGTWIGELGPAVAAATGLRAGTPLILGGGDQQCADLGAGVVDPGRVAANLGTAGVISAPSDRPVIDPRGRLVCLAHVVPGRWVLEGLETSYGGGLRWGADLLGEDPLVLAARAPLGARGLTWVPYLDGSGAPDYDRDARASLLGLTSAHGRADVARAIVEGITGELVRILDAARELVAVSTIVASGGPAQSGLLLEMLAGIAGVPVAVAPQVEASLVGAAILAWLGLGRWPNLHAAVAALPRPAQVVSPHPERTRLYRSVYGRYQAALAGLRQARLLSFPAEAQHG